MWPFKKRSQIDEAAKRLVQRMAESVIDTRKMQSETEELNLTEASEEQLMDAYIDCVCVYAFEYPETERGTYAALTRAEEIRAEYASRGLPAPVYDPRGHSGII